MRYDLRLICELCRQAGFPVQTSGDQRVEVDLGHGAILGFQNAKREEDCGIGFLGMAWHAHDGLTFVDARGQCVHLDYLDLVAGLKEGRVLVCELEVEGRTVDRWLTHSEYNTELKHVQEGER